MYLAELELQGFKSFPHKTRVTFDKGVTAIVGPNGCGKSNIVDALRWVLGEQRPSLLRSATMTNVIFNGTATKKALGMAEVSVTITNNKGILPTEFTDVTVTRRLYRSGDSDYLLNRKPCRLRDITDLFMDTGMGSNAYSVIELKMVEEILNDKNNDRRKLFEEAAGITRFKERKKQTLKKLENTRADMQRLEDILVEIRKKTRSLQIQASRADRARKYQKEMKFLDKAIAMEEYRNIRADLDPLLDQVAGASASREELRQRHELLEKNIEQAHNELMDREQIQNEVRKKLTGTLADIQDKRTQIEIARQKIKSEEGVIRQYETDITQAESDIRDLRSNLENNRKELGQAEESLQKIIRDRHLAEQTLGSCREQVRNVRDKLEENRQAYAGVNRRLADLQNLQVRLEARIENAGEQQERLLGERESGRKKISSLAEERNAMKKRHEELSGGLIRAEEALTAIRKQREELQSLIQAQKDEIRTLKSRYDAYESEYRLLRNLSESADTHPASVQYLLMQRDDFEILELVSDLFSCAEEDVAAVEAALGDLSSSLVTRSDEEALRAFSLLRKKDRGRVMIIPLNRLAGDYDTEAGSLYHRVNCEKTYDPLCRLLFGQILFTETMEEASALSASEKRTAVTRDGDLVTERGFLYSGSKNRDAGVRIGLREKIEKREQQATGTRKQIRLAEAELDRLNRQYHESDPEPYRKAVREAAEHLQDQQRQRDAIDTREQYLRQSVDALLQQVEQLKETDLRTREERDTLEPEKKKLAEEAEVLVRREVTLKSDLQEKEEAYQRAQKRHNDIILHCQNAENSVNNLQRDIDRFEQNVESIKERLRQRAEQAKSSKDRIISCRSEIENGEEELSSLLTVREKTEKELQQAEESCSRQHGKINLLETELRETGRKKEMNQELLHNLEMARSRLEMEQKNLSDHIWDTYELTMDQITERLADDTDVATARETLFTLRERIKNIGEVNPLAIEEYEQERERLDHFEKQIDDLEKAEEQLLQTIGEINRDAQERFSTTFHEIRENFRSVFSTLFEENDHCDLIIDDSTEDSLEAKIEIIANPRGKRPSVIEQLSGGEKTLTAIALLFAIYLVKPSPFCVMDEVDAPLDDPNILRFTRLLKRFSEQTQFIVITHNKITMENSEMMYGVTMPDTGISKLVGVRLEEVPA